MLKLMMNKSLIVITSGEPGGIGPDICLDIPLFLDINAIIVVISDAQLLQSRADLLNKKVNIVKIDYADLSNRKSLESAVGLNTLFVLHIECPNHDTIGRLMLENVMYVVRLLDVAIKLCQDNVVDAIVTAPVNKEIINKSGIVFSGHTEYLAAKFGINKVVMMLSNSFMNVALLTTHIRLRDVATYVTVDNLNQTIDVIVNAFQRYFNEPNPRIAVCGLNPHAGEGGYLGDEEVSIINPVIKNWQKRGFCVSGSYSADTIFNQAKDFDVILAMYHDQGLPVLKYAGFENGINVTLGLPIVRVSVDHGTALDIAGKGLASSKSLHCALKFAQNMVL